MPQNIAEFRIIGRIGKITAREKVTYVSVAANYNGFKLHRIEAAASVAA